MIAEQYAEHVTRLVLDVSPRGQAAVRAIEEAAG